MLANGCSERHPVIINLSTDLLVIDPLINPATHLLNSSEKKKGMNNVYRASIQFGMHADSWESTEVAA